MCAKAKPWWAMDIAIIDSCGCMCVGCRVSMFKCVVLFSPAAVLKHIVTYLYIKWLICVLPARSCINYVISLYTAQQQQSVYTYTHIQRHTQYSQHIHTRASLLWPESETCRQQHRRRRFSNSKLQRQHPQPEVSIAVVAFDKWLFCSVPGPERVYMNTHTHMHTHT